MDKVPRAARERGGDLAVWGAARKLMRAFVTLRRLRRDQAASEDVDQAEEDLLGVIDWLIALGREESHPPVTIRFLTDLFGDLQQPLEGGQP